VCRSFRLPNASTAVIVACAVKIRKQRVFQWSQRHNWERVFLRLLADELNGAVITEIRRTHPECLSDDDFVWLNAAVAGVNKHAHRDIPALLTTRLSNYYESIVAFHATRSASARDFLDQGIQLSDTAALQARAVERLGESEELKQNIIEFRRSGYEEHNNGKIYLCLTKDGCLKDNKYCMICGSEYLGRLADHPEQTAKLRSGGKPLVVECRVPASALDLEFWRGRSFAILDDYLTRLVRPLGRPKVKGSCVVLREAMSADNILRVHEFTEVTRTIRWNDCRTGAVQKSEFIALCPFKIWLGRARL
jgi:hypothetical protein